MLRQKSDEGAHDEIEGVSEGGLYKVEEYRF